MRFNAILIAVFTLYAAQSFAVIVSSPSPVDGGLVPVTTSALSFTLEDNGLMTYEVTTSPDVGSANGFLVPSGTYSVLLSELAPDTTYTWTVRVNGAVAATYTFRTYQPSQWGFDAWKYRKTITIDSSKVYSDLADFPVLIDITDSDLASKAKSDGSDIIFTINGVQLAHEIESYSQGRLIAWVKVPMLSSVTDTEILMYYGNPSASAISPKSAWDSGYLGVYHMNKQGQFPDSTVRNNAGSVLGGAALTQTGMIGSGYSFDGIDDRIQFQPIMTNQAQFTFEAWVNSASKQGYIIAQRDTLSRGAFVQYYSPDREFQIYGDSKFTKQTGSPNEWHHVAGVSDGSTLRIYVDGVSAGVINGAVTWPNVNLLIGDRAVSGRQFQGRMDEARISSIARSEGYIRTSYNNQKSPASFISVGSEEQKNNMPELFEIMPSNGAMNTQLNPTLSGRITDPDGDTFQYKIEVQEQEKWIVLKEGSAPGQVYFSAVPTTVLEYETFYSWRVIVIDKGKTEQHVFSFTTMRETNNLPLISEESPLNGTENVAFRPTLSAYIYDADEDNVAWSIQLYTTSWTTIGSGTVNGQGTVQAIANAATASNKDYLWRVRANDGYGSQVENTYTFRTEFVNSPVIVSNEYPLNNSEDVPLNPTLQAEIMDPEGEPVSWRIQIFRNGSFVTVAQGTESDGQATITAGTTQVTSYNTVYPWKVIATDTGSGKTTEALYSFRTRENTYPPEIINVTPAAAETAVPLNTSLVACIEDKDGHFINVTISFQTPGGWVTLSSYNNSLPGCFGASARGYATESLTKYNWRVHAADTTNRAVTQDFSFTTGGLLKLKYSKSFASQNFIQPHPLMGDVDNDGVNELVFNAGYYVYVLDGRNGNLKWRAPDSLERAPELVDLNNDGVPEIIYGARGPTVRAYYGNGTLMWTSPWLSGDDTTMFPLVAFDIEGTGYPRIYFATEDTKPDPYSGDPNDYKGRLWMLDHNGKILAQTWIHHPCWGGVSLGDADFDGRFEVYVSDRRAGYHNFTENKGLQAFDAHTLAPLWNTPWLQHSSPMGVLADVLGDEKLEMVATEITIRGPYVMNAVTGEIYANYANARLPTHATPTVYDLDGDGNKEAIYSTSYPAGTPYRNVTVFDLVTGKLDFSASFPSRVAWPPKVGDVTGDGKMEMLVATGEQDDANNTYQIYIYDRDYVLLDRIDVPLAGQLTPVRLYDVDKDGLQELVVMGVAGRLYVYDTPAPVPSPAPRTWVQFYSEYRQGAAEYVEPPGPKAPKISNMTPTNGSVNVPLGVTLSARVHDFQQDRMTVKIDIDSGAGWQNVATFSNRANGIVSFHTAGIVNKNGTDYLWRITADDGKGHVSERIQSFRTAGTAQNTTNQTNSTWDFPQWAYRKEVRINRNLVSGTVQNLPVLVDINDANLAARARADGRDIIFTLGNTILPHDIESYSNGRLVAWVKVPQVSSSADTVLNMYYGNAAYTSPAGTPVWEGYNAVYHMGGFTDSSVNAKHGTASGNPSIVSGLIGSAVNADGVDDRIVLPQLFSSETSYTMEGWLNTGNKHGYAISQRAAGSSGAFIQYYAPAGEFQLYSNSAFVRVPGSTGAWHYVVGTFDGTTARLYVNGGTPATAATSITWPVQNAHLLDRMASGRQYLGLLDEVRLSPIARSPDYIRTNYNMVTQKAQFVQIGSEQSR